VVRVRVRTRVVGGEWSGWTVSRSSTRARSARVATQTCFRADNTPPASWKLSACFCLRSTTSPPSSSSSTCSAPPPPPVDRTKPNQSINRNHQHAHCDDESLVRGDSGQSAVRLTVCVRSSHSINKATIRAVLTNGHTGHVPRAPRFFLF